MRAVATIVPVRSLMMTRAGTSGMISSDSICEIKSTGEPVHVAGRPTRTVVESTATELAGNLALSTAAMREAEVKSGLRNSNSKWLSLKIVAGISALIRAPLMMVPTVG